MGFIIGGILVGLMILLLIEFKKYQLHKNYGVLWTFEEFIGKISNINIDNVYGIKLSRDERLQIAGNDFYYDLQEIHFSFIDFLLVKIFLFFKKNRNSLGYVEKHDRKLIIMRALPGAGKSTEANRLVGDGIIHSTDDIMSKIGNGDYSKAFSMEINGKPALSVAHRRNFYNAKESMEDGLNPVIIDNTNLSRTDVKTYAKEALKLGYKDQNIEVIDLGLNGFTLEELVERNTHGVGIEMMTEMFEKYKNNSPATLEFIFKNGK